MAGYALARFVANSLDNEFVDEVFFLITMEELYNELEVVKRNFEIEEKKRCKDN